MIILIVIIMVNIKKVYTKFKAILEKHKEFVINFEETPRSKFAKKYIPPMDVLNEE